MNNEMLKSNLKTCEGRLALQRKRVSELELTVAHLEGTIKGLEYINKLLKEERHDLNSADNNGAT